MDKNPSYEELNQKVKELENVSIALRKAESALRESEERYRLVLDNAIVPILYFDLTGNILLINTIGAKNLDGTVDEIVGKTVYDIVPQFANTIFKRIRRVEETGRGSMYEDFIELPQGKKCFFSSVEPVRDIEGTINGVQMICVDITDRKKIEQELEESEEKYRLMAETASIGIYQFDEKGKFIFLNDAYVKILGYNKADLLDRHLNVVIPEKEIPDSGKIIEKALSGELWKGEVSAKHKLGHKVPVNISMVAMKKNGAVLGVHGSMEDITKRKRAENALRASEEKARALLNATTATAILADKEGIILAINKAGAKRIGKSVDEIIGTCSYDYISHETRELRKAEVDEVIQTGLPMRNEHENEGVIFDQNIYPMFDKNGTVNGIANFLLDVTERRRAEEELIEKKKELEIKSVDLEEVNTALRVLLRTREEDKKVLEGKVLFSVKDLIMPYIEKLKMRVNDQRHESYLDIIESNLNDIVSPFMTAKATELYKLTPTQIHVANFVKQGKSTKQIAEILHLSTSTIDSHRNTIRKKLGITNKNLNLRSFLLSRDNN